MSPNRLAGEKSPYLLQHADNPVDWHPWGEEVFARARAKDLPVFLSVGYSTCHWCHVMERESFEDPEVARLLNEAFVCVKVDREERPDVDSVYMTVCQLMTGSGGWPLTVLLTPDGEPFFAGTYFPRTSRHGRVGMLDLVPRVRELWASRRSELLRSAAGIREALARTVERGAGHEPGTHEMEVAYRALRAAFDAHQAGFGPAPRFPTPHVHMFLLRYWYRTGAADALGMVEATLRAMRRGGLYDQIGFGFHRYSTDARWLVPHFEKMLYDQALLTLVYLEAFQATGREEYSRTAAEILEYVRRDMRDASGAFHSAEDADSEGEEGLYYLWSDDELRQLLDAETFRVAKEVWNVQQAGNFAEEATGRRTGRNILHRSGSGADAAGRLGVSEEELRTRMEKAREILLASRSRRQRPHRDDKILTDWNGLMIAALARAAAVMEAPECAEAACSAADFLLRELRDSAGRLLHRYRDGEAAIAAMADDYAFLCWGLIELHQATLEPHWLEEALRLNEQFLSSFYDSERGGFFATAHDGQRLLVRTVESHDGATPSANSVALLNLLRLGRLTGDTSLEERAAQLARGLGGRVAAAPAAHAHFLSGVDFALGPAREIVVVGIPGEAGVQGLLQEVRERYLPRAVLLLKPSGAGGREDPVTALAPFTGPLTALGEEPTAYVCTGFACDRPTVDPAELGRLLDERLSTD